jgi:CysZ protein
VLSPALLSLLLSLALAVWALGAVVQQMMAYPPMTTLSGWGSPGWPRCLAYLGGWMAIFAIAYLTASLLAAIVIMPLMLKHLAENEYRDVARWARTVSWRLRPTASWPRFSSSSPGWRRSRCG